MVINSSLAFFIGAMPKGTIIILAVLFIIFTASCTYIIHLIMDGKREEDKRRNGEEEGETPKLTYDPFYTDYKVDEPSNKKTRI